MKIIPLSEGSFTIDYTKIFIPIDAETESIQNRSKGSLLVEIQPFVVITERDIILIDTGLGYNLPNGVSQLHHNLMQLGINPSQVTKVLLSHLHKDHAGGVTLKQADGQQFISFPYATYYLQKREFEFAFDAKSKSYITEDFQLLEEFSKVFWLNEDEGLIDGYIHYQLTQAHSKFHQVFWIKEDNQVAFFGGDDAPQLSQMKSKFVAKYDYDGKKCMELRQQWWEQGNMEQWQFMFYHDIKTPVYPFK